MKIRISIETHSLQDRSELGDFLLNLILLGNQLEHLLALWITWNNHFFGEIFSVYDLAQNEADQNNG